MVYCQVLFGWVKSTNDLCQNSNEKNFSKAYFTLNISKNQSGHGHFMKRLAVKLIKLTRSRSVFSVLNLFKPEYIGYHRSLYL